MRQCPANRNESQNRKPIYGTTTPVPSILSTITHRPQPAPYSRPYYVGLHNHALYYQILCSAPSTIVKAPRFGPSLRLSICS